MTEQVSDLSAKLWAAVRANPVKPFWISPTETYSYADLERQLRAATGRLRHHDVRPGAFVLIAVPDDWYAFCTWIGCLLNGVVPILMAPDASADHLRRIAQIAPPALMVTGAARAEERRTLAASAFVLTDQEMFARPCEDDPSLIRPETDMAYVLFTSGSTSAPKGVVISHRALAAQLATIAAMFRVSEGSRVCNGLVLYHVDGLVQGPLLAAMQSATLLRPEAFRADRIAAQMDWLARQDATHMVAAPALLDMIDRACPRDDYFRRDGVVGILSSSARLPTALWDRIETRFGAPVINEYGMTETVAASHFAGPFPEMGAAHSIGKPVDCDARVVGDDGAPCRAGEVGELQIRGANLFSGYLGDPDRTASAFSGDWFRTGDLAKVDAKGDYHVMGRRDDAINSGGFLIWPDDIDDVVLRHPDVRDVRTIAQDDPVFDQVPVTAYVSDPPVAPDTLLAFCRIHLEARKMPRRLVPVAAIPRTGSGKTDRPALARLIQSSSAGRTTGGGDVKARVLELAAQVFGVAQGTLNAATSQEDTTGWDSYAHTALILELEAAFGIDLPLDEAMNAATLQVFIDLVTRATVPEEPGSAIRMGSLRRGNGDGTLVFLPGLSGRMPDVKRLVAHLDPWPAVQALTIDADRAAEHENHSMQELADAFATQIIALDPKPPLVLFGSSFGGFLAYETAVSLRRLGHAVNHVIMIDTAVPWRHRKTRYLNHVGQTLREAKRVIAKLRSGAREAHADTSLWIKEFGRVDPGPLHPSLSGIVMQSFERLARYRPSQDHVPQLIFVARDRRNAVFSLGPTLGWDRFNHGPIDAVELGASHGTAISDPNDAQSVARRIDALFIRRTPEAD